MTTIRKPVTLDEALLALLERLKQEESSRHALVELLGGVDVGTSEAAVLTALLRVGARCVDERVLEYGYAQYAADLADDPEFQGERDARRAARVNREARRVQAGL